MNSSLSNRNGVDFSTAFIEPHIEDNFMTTALFLRSALVSCTLLTAILMTGCATSLQTAGSTTVTPVGSQRPGLTGSVHGGQQPVSGATIQLYAVSTSGYAAAATPLITPSSVTSGTGTYPVTTDANGNFTISGDYTCPSGSYVYLTATGGNPGLSAGTNNTAIVIMAALGSCAAVKAGASTTFASIQLNEVSTVAGAWALSRFMSGPTAAGTSSTNATGLVNAFAAANNIDNLATGTAPGATLPTGATVPVAEVNSLADILAACINSSGATTTGTACGTLFTAATPPGGTALADTLTAALDIAQNPTNNVTTLYNLATSSSPFQPALTTAPANWLIGIHYTGGGLATPTALAVDNSGDVWIANSNSVSEFSSTGAALSPSSGYRGGSLSSPSGIAIDLSGNAWISNSGNASVTEMAPLGASASNFTGGGLNQPSSIAIDGSGYIWVTNKGNNSVSQLSSTGTALSPNVTGYTGAGLSQPVGIAINSH